MIGLSNREDNRLLEYQAILEKLAQLAAREGIQVTPYASNHPLHFSVLPENLKDRTLRDLRNYLTVSEGVVAGGKSLLDDNHVLWRMFQEMGVHPPMDLMPLIDSGDMVEIYDADYIQVFRNLRFFSACSYTLDELLSRPFWELFRREETITMKIVEVAQKLFTGKLSGVQRWDTPVHTVDEIAGQAPYHAEVQNKILSPLYHSSGRVVAAVHTFRVLKLERRAG